MDDHQVIYRTQKRKFTLIPSKPQPKSNSVRADSVSTSSPALIYIADSSRIFKYQWQGSCATPLGPRTHFQVVFLREVPSLKFPDFYFASYYYAAFSGSARTLPSNSDLVQSRHLSISYSQLASLSFLYHLLFAHLFYFILFYQVSLYSTPTFWDPPVSFQHPPPGSHLFRVFSVSPRIPRYALTRSNLDL
ncbi:hypothetical protein K439DRAFT_410400 [Ramaria rubella]|nr:hypothetical protein K439DRAFT_410400 [Ramaria rubella]